MSGAGGPARAVHQFVPALQPRDATGIHTLLLRDALRRAGWRSEVFAEAIHDDLAGEAFKVWRYPERAAADDVLVYQFSTSSMVAEVLAARTEPLVLDYHNITAPELYRQWDSDAARRSAEAWTQLRALAPRAVLGMADSELNRRDLVVAGCTRTEVVPVLMDHDRLPDAGDARVAGRLAAARAGGGADWVFVGRVVPPKAQHQLVKALWAYRRLYDPRARLHLVGAATSRRYLQALRRYIQALGLSEAVRITGEVPDAALAAYLDAADVYVSLSLHEGFGVPLVEAMRRGLPVVALDAGAVADTLGGAGLVLAHDEPSYVAAAVHRVLGDDRLHGSLVAAGRRRAAALSTEAAARAAVDALATVAGPPPALVGAGR